MKVTQQVKVKNNCMPKGRSKKAKCYIKEEVKFFVQKVIKKALKKYHKSINSSSDEGSECN
eukprot:15112709-Ditylum_brightwellii.AAC.1